MLAGWLSDRIGTLKVTISMIVLNALSILALLTAPNAFSLVAFSFLFGTVYSVPVVGITLLTREFFRTVNYGKVYPGISFALSIGGAFSLSLVGYVYDFSGSYVPAFLIALVFHALHIFFVSLAAKQSRKQQEEVKAL
ncbi:MFS transporter [Atopococcus tabaci]|uniref:MFS transporter n=1 Tax=Atopococcus tabaci TaxID=269774 RepID=UPI0006866E0D|nr:MFS transporter [Atopococcus tabaci]